MELDLKPQVFVVLPGLKGLKVTPVRQARMVHVDLREIPVIQEHKDLREIPVLRGLQALPVLKGIQAQEALPEQKVTRVMGLLRLLKMDTP